MQLEPTDTEEQARRNHDYRKIKTFLTQWDSCFWATFAACFLVMEFEIFTLANGIRVIHQPSPGDVVAHCGLFVNVGSRDEHPNQQGIAHLIEHCLFKGTAKRKAFHILSGLDAVGGELNAYTTKENTVIYASCLNKHFSKAVDLISDITFNSTFPEKEIKKEKEVVVDEIYSYLDSPGEAIFDDFEEQLYGDHPIGSNILGTTESVVKLNREELLGFVKEHFTTDRMVFAVVGSIGRKKIEKIAERFLGVHPATQSKLVRKGFSNYVPKHAVVEGNFHQTHCLIGNLAPSANDESRTALVVLNNLLGGPAMNSRLNLNIREKFGYTYNLESNYSMFTDTGMLGVYFGTDPKYAKKTHKLIVKEMAALRNAPLTERQLHNAKQQLIGQIALSQESRINTMLTLGKSLLLYNRVQLLEEVYDRILSIDATQVHAIAQKVFDESQLSSLTFHPKKQ